MPAFVRPFKAPPLETFTNFVVSAHSALRTTYLTAFAAASERNRLLDDVLLAEISVSSGRYNATQHDALELHRAAYAQDILADLQSSVVILAADNALQRLGRSLFGKRLGLAPGFGPNYHGGHLTSLLNATTNCIRHVDDWDENEKLDFPYVTVNIDDIEDWETRTALRSIAVLDKALGVGKLDRIWAPPSFHVLVTIDGLFGTHPTEYARFEWAVIRAARSMVQLGSPELLSQFDNAVSALPLPVTEAPSVAG